MAVQYIFYINKKQKTFLYKQKTKNVCNYISIFIFMSLVNT